VLHLRFKIKGKGKSTGLPFCVSKASCTSAEGLLCFLGSGGRGEDLKLIIYEVSKGKGDLVPEGRSFGDIEGR
jgi:hypothetical protein